MDGLRRTEPVRDAATAGPARIGLERMEVTGADRMRPASERTEATGADRTRPASERTEVTGADRTRPASERTEATGADRTRPASERTEATGADRTRPASERTDAAEAGRMRSNPHPAVLLLRLMRADWLKTRRTPLRLAVLASPAMYALLLLGYYANRRTTPDLALDMMGAFAEGWTSLLPLAVGVLAGLLCLQEEHAGNYAALLGSPAPRPVVYAARLLQLVLIHTGSVLCASALMLLGMRAWLGVPAPDAGMFFACALLAAAGALPLIALHLWIGLAAGWGASVGAGGAGLLIAAIVGATSVGDRIWPYIAWAWPVRLSLVPLEPNPPADVLTRGLPLALAVFVLLAAGGAAWFRRWEGRRGED